MFRRLTSILAIFISVVLVSAFGVEASQAETAAFMRQQRSFRIDSRPDVGTRVYYDCDTVESQIESFLEQLGAKNVDVQCHGGFDRNLPEIAWEADVDISFESLRLVRPGTRGAINANYKSVRVREWDSCYLLNQTLDEVQTSFVLRNVVGPSRCSSTRDSFRLEALALFP